MAETLGVVDVEGQGLLRELAVGAVAAAREIGVSARLVRPIDEPLVDNLLLIGFPALASQLFQRPPASRRILWCGEPLPAPGASRLIRLVRPATPPVRLLDRVHSLAALTGLAPITLGWRESAASIREQLRMLASIKSVRPNLGDIFVTNQRSRMSLAEEGIVAEVADLGYHSSWAGPITAPSRQRSVDVLVLGKIHPRTRRERVTANLVAQLAPDVTVAVERGTYGPQRTELLGRTKILVDVQRIAGNYAGTRMVLAAAAGTLYISEPIADSGVWRAGRHFLEAQLDQLPLLIRDVIADEEYRRGIVLQAQSLIEHDLTMADAVKRVLGVAARDGR